MYCENLSSIFNQLISLNSATPSHVFYPVANKTLQSYFEKPVVFFASLFLG